jgi:hypothetical protein
MSRQSTKLARLAVIGLSACALLPATASAMPINDGTAPAQHVVGQAIAAGGGPGVTVSTLASPAPTGGSDAVSGSGYHVTATSSKSFTGGGDVVSGRGYHFNAVASDSGFDTGVLVALGVGIVLALGAWLLVVATKPRTRERQAA